MTKSEMTLYIPPKKEFLFISEGTGDNLLPEDMREGYVDYVNIDRYVFTGDIDSPFVEVDGGMMLLKKPYQDSFNDDDDLARQCIEYMYDKDIAYTEIEHTEEVRV